MSSDEKRPLGKILLQRKLVSQQELDTALRAQKRSVTPAPLASQLFDDGMVAEVDALRALSEQYGVPGIDLTQIAIVLDHLDVVPRELAEASPGACPCWCAATSCSWRWPTPTRSASSTSSSS